MRRSIQLVTALILISYILPIYVGAVENTEMGGGTRNNPSRILIPINTPPRYEQLDRIIIQPIVSDPDPEDEYSFHVNMEEDLNGVESVLNQVPLFGQIRGVNWNFSSDTGEFWWQIDDEKIWADDDQSLDSISVHIMFGIKNKSGQWDFDSIWLTLDNLERPPEKPDQINYEIEGFEELLTGVTGYTIKFWVDNVTDPDGDPVKYRWQFGDGSSATGRVLWHSYATRGYVTVQMWTDDGKLTSEKIAVLIDIPVPDDENQDMNDQESSAINPGELLLVTLIGGFFFAVFIFLAIIGSTLISKSLSRPRKDEIDEMSSFNERYQN